MLTRWDMSARFPSVPRSIVELATATGLVFAITALRLVIDRLYAGVVPYPLVFPAIALATIFAGPRSGATVLVGGQILAWYLFGPTKGSLRPPRPGMWSASCSRP